MLGSIAIAGCTSGTESSTSTSTAPNAETNTSSTTTTKSVNELPWPQLQQNANNTGKSPVTGPDGDSVSVEWEISSDTVSFLSSVVVKEGTLYAGANSLLAIDGKTGERLWEYEHEEGEVAVLSVATDGERLVSTMGKGSGNEWLIAIDLETREKLWQSDRINFDFTTPTIVDREIFVGSATGTVYSFSATDGSINWERSLEGNVDVTPAVSGSRVIVKDRSGTVYSINRKDGSVDWETTCGEPRYSSPTIFEDTVFIAGNGSEVMALSIEDGEKLWEFDTGTELLSSVGIGEKSVIAPAKGKVVAITLEGDEKWETELPPDQITLSSPAIVDRTAYFGMGKSVFGVGLNQGEIRWQHELEHPTITSSPAVWNELVFMGSGMVDGGNGGKLVALG